MSGPSTELATASSSAAAAAAGSGGPSGSWVMDAVCGVVNALRNSVPSDGVRAVGETIDIKKHLEDWGNQYFVIMNAISSCGPLVNAAIKQAFAPVVSSISANWRELIPAFLREAKSGMDKFNSNLDTEWEAVLDGLRTILEACSVFGVRFPSAVQYGTAVVDMSDLRIIDIWRRTPTSPPDPRIATPLSDESRVSILLALKVMLRSASVITTALNPMSAAVLGRASDFLSGRRSLTPSDLLAMMSDLQSTFSGQALGSIVELAPSLISSVRAESQAKAKYTSK